LPNADFSMSFKKTLLLAVILLGALWYIYRVELPQDEVKRKEEFFLGGKPIDSFTRVTIQRGTESVGFVNTAPVNTPPVAENAAKDDGMKNWKIESLPDAKIDEAAVNSLLTTLSNLKLTDPFRAEKAEDITLYGLQDPEIKVTVATADSTRELSLGKKSDYFNKRYVKTPDSSEIFLIEESLYSSASKPVADFRSKSPVGFDQTQVAKAILEQKGARTVLEQSSAGQWTLKEPLEATANGDLVTTLLRELRTVQVKSFIDPPAADLASKGLVTPTVKVTLEFKEGKSPPLVLSLAEERKGEVGEVYLAVSGQPSIYSLTESDLKPFEKTTDDFRERRLLKFDSWDTEEAKFSLKGDEPLILKKVQSEWKVNGEPADDVFVNDFLSTISNTEATRFLSKDQAASLSNPELTIEITTLASTRFTFLIFRRGNEFVGLKGGSQEPFVISSEQYQKLLPKKEVLKKSEASKDKKQEAQPGT
jgi:hypothetical protein